MKRVRVVERDVAIVAASFGALAAIFAHVLDVSPTGRPFGDGFVVFVAVGLAAWLAASAPWWALGAAGGVAALTGFALLPILLGAAGAATAFAIGTTRADLGVARTVSAGCTLLALCDLRLGLWFGASSVVGISVALLLVVTGLARRRRAVRTWARRAAVAAAVAAGLATLGAGWSMLDARDGLVDGREFFETGIDRLRSGDTEQATADFERAEEAFAAADRTLHRPWSRAAQLVPVVANHREVVVVAARAGRAASADIATLSLAFDIDAIRPRSGRFDLDAIDRLRAPFARAYATLLDVGSDLDGVRSSWLVGPVQTELRAVTEEFTENIATFATLTSAVDRAPMLLGADDPRRYFVAFTTPAEARGTGGFMGNFAILDADRGRVTLTGFGRTQDLNRGFTDRTVSAPADWLRQWGRYGFTNGPDGTTGDEPWSNITISPHFPSTGAAVASLASQSGRGAVDGVIAIDPFVLEAFVGFTGPITVSTSDSRLTEDNTAQFLLFDQYTGDNDERVDALEQVATETVSALLDGALPDPVVLADRLGPLVEQERLVAWMADPDDQALLQSVGMSGGLPALDGDDDGFSVVLNNAGANKLDAFLARTFRYDATYSTSDGPGTEVDGELNITLTNSAPTTGLDDGVIGNYVGDPVGTNRSLVTVYTAAAVESVSVDGDDVPTQGGREAGWTLTTFVVTTAAGASTDIVVHVDGSLLDNDGVRRAGSDGPSSPSLVVRTQPLVDTPSYVISTGGDPGSPFVAHDGEVVGARRWATG